MSSVIDRIKGRLPEFYDDDNSNIMKLLNAFTEEIDIVNSNVDRVSNLDNIDLTNGDDLYVRWGSLLCVPRKSGESNESYRARLKIAVTSLTGGTIDAIKYSIAVGLNVNSDTNAMDKISVYDGWEYTGADVEEIYKAPCNIICIVDMDNGLYSTDVEDIVRQSVNIVKVGGVRAHILFYNYRIEYYIELDNVPYIALNSLEYDKIGG